MSEKIRVKITVLLVLVSIGGLCSWLVSQEEPDLRGVWRVVSYTRDGQRINQDGFMIITSDHFTRVLMERDRQKFDFDFRAVEELTLDQRKQVAETFPRSNASAGKYWTENGVFYFNSLVHHNPGAVGNVGDRNLELQGDRLRLYGSAGSGNLEEVWERVEKF